MTRTVLQWGTTKEARASFPSSLAGAAAAAASAECQAAEEDAKPCRLW